jgi:DNA-binding transcriptional LysR family regulator
VKLTVGARAARRRFAIALAELGTVREEACLAERAALTRLRVGAMAVAAMGFLPRVMPLFLSSAGRAQVQVVEGTIDNLTDLLINGELDCVIGRRAQNWEHSNALAGQIEEVRLLDDPRCVVCRSGHPVIQRQPLSLAVLAREDWILPPVPSSSRVLFDQLFFEAGMSPPLPIVESASVQSNMEMVATTNLLSVVALGIARRTIAAGNLQQLQIALDLPPMPLSFLWRPSGDKDELVQWFMRAATSAAADTAASPGLAM